MTFVAALLATAVSRKGAVELERRSRREESMRHLKWAAELAVSDDDRRARRSFARPRRRSRMPRSGAKGWSSCFARLQRARALGRMALEPRDARRCTDYPGDGGGTMTKYIAVTRTQRDAARWMA